MDDYPAPSRSSRYSFSSSKRSPESIIADPSDSDDRKMKLKRRSLTRADYSYDSHRSSRSTDHSRERGDVMYWEQGGEVKREKKPKRDPKEKEERRERRKRERSGTVDGGEGVRIPAEVVEHRKPTEEHRRVSSQPTEEHRRISSQPTELEQRRSGTQSTEVSPADTTTSTAKPAPASKQSVMKEVVKAAGMGRQLPPLPEPVSSVAPTPPPKAAIIPPPPPPKAPVVAVAAQEPAHQKAPTQPPAAQPTPAVPVPSVKKPPTPPLESAIQVPAPAPARPASPPGSVAKPPSPTNRPLTPPHSTPSSPTRKKSPATVHFTPSTVTPSSPPSTFRAPPPTRTRAKRPHSFSTKALVSYNVPDEDQTTPRGKPPRRASNPYPSYGYDNYPPPQPFPYPQQMYPEPQPIYPEPQQIYPEPQGYPEYSYTQAQDPFQYMEKPERAERAERRRSRRRSKEEEEEATRKVRGDPTVEVGDTSDSAWTESRDPSMTRSPITTIPEHLPETPALDAEHYGPGPEQYSKQQYPSKPDPFPVQPSVVDMSATLPPSPTAPPAAPPQIYPRFTSLNTLILQHMVAEIEGLSAALTQIDSSPPTPHTQQQRLELLNTLAWKLEKYNLAATSYHATFTLPSAPVEEVAAYTQHLPLPPSVDEKEFFTLTPAPPAVPALPSVCTLLHHPPCSPGYSPDQKVVEPTSPRRWYTPPAPALTPTAMHLLTIAAILIAPWVVEFVKHSRVQVGEEKVWGWEMYALRGTMWVLALAAAVVEVVKGKGWFAFCVLVVGLGCVLGLLAGS